MSKLIIYHGMCNDGFAAAWIAHKVFPDACFFAANHGQEPPDVTGKDVYMLDFAYKRPIMLKIYEKAKSIVVLDHHKTAATDLDGLSFCTFDMNKSGATLAWQQFGDSIGGEMPWLIDYTEDRDLQRYHLPYSREINAAIDSYQMTFEVWNQLSEYKDVLKSPLVAEGQSIIRFQERLIDNIIKHARPVELDGYIVKAANTSCIFSQVANRLAQDFPFGVAWYLREDGRFVHSLQSTSNGADVSEIAIRHGGGGHPHSAGFESQSMVLRAI